VAGRGTPRIEGAADPPSANGIKGGIHLSSNHSGSRGEKGLHELCPCEEPTRRIRRLTLLRKNINKEDQPGEGRKGYTSITLTFSRSLEGRRKPPSSVVDSSKIHKETIKRTTT